MAASMTTSAYEDEEDVDVVWEGSPLHEHLKAFGIEEETESRHLARPITRRLKRPSGQQSLAHHVQWPRGCSSILEVEVAKKIMESELLVQEDQDFLSNFILTDEAFADYEKKLQDKSHGGSSLLSDVIFFTGSVAAVAGTILYLSERTRLATTMAAVLPTALAAFSSARSAKTEHPEKEKEEFLKLVDLLLNDMKVFKQMVRKSLNLLHGMELMNSGYLFAINRSTGVACTSTSNDLRQISQLSEASFPALRFATYQCTIQLLETYREALGKLMQVSPLAEYIDMKEHYIAFVDLECFGIEKSSSISVEGDAITVKSLKDAVQLALVQQSEYLRRFSLVFCDRVREENGLNQLEIIGQVREVAATIRKINGKLSGVFEYHQALGINSKQKMLNIKKKQLQFNFVPLRSLYTSLFSTGLHLQNSLLRVRKMETIFDAMEKSKRPESGPMFPSETQIVEWLRGFQDVQRELNACVGCLEEGVSQIHVLKGDEDSLKDDDVSPADDSQATDDESQKDVAKIQLSGEESEIDDENFDQVFEAFVTCERSHSQLDNDEDDDRFTNPCASKISSNKLLMSELKMVLVGKAEEHRYREEKAIERKNLKLTSKTKTQFNENGQSSNSNCAEEKMEQVQNDVQPPETLAIDPDLKSSLENRKLVDNGGQDFERFFDLQNVAPVSTKIDPFCPNGTSYRSCQNGFDDDFLSQATKDSDKSKVSQEKDSVGDTSDDDDDDDEEDGLSSSSSHASTIKSVRASTTAKNAAAVIKSESSSTYSDESDTNLDGRPYPKVGHGHHRKYTRRRMHFNGKVSNKNGDDGLHHPDQGDSNAIDSNDTVSVAEIRSVSTPDLKQLAVLSSPYVSLEDVHKTPSKTRPEREERESSDGSNSSDWGSMDELENYTLKTFKRPLRPVALRKSQLRSRNSTEDPNNSKSSHVKASEDIPPSLEEIRRRIANQEQTSDSVYRRRHQGEINEVRQPSGFESFLASQVVAKAQQFSKKFNFMPKEETFGSDSD